jgi:hypothetical protein
MVFLSFVVELHQLAAKDPLDHAHGETPVDEVDRQLCHRAAF